MESYKLGGYEIPTRVAHRLGLGEKVVCKNAEYFVPADLHLHPRKGKRTCLLLGIALAKQNNIPLPESWGVANSAGEAARKLGIDRSAVNEAEVGIEARVSEYIGQMPFLWPSVNDAPGPISKRGLIERNAVALLSGYGWPCADRPSAEWLGHYSDRERVCLSGLWNNHHVDETYDPSFLDEMEWQIDATPR